MNAMSHLARGMAHVAKGQLADAEKELTAIGAIKDDPSLKTLMISPVNPGAPIVGIAYEVLSGELAAKRRRAGDAVRHFAAAVRLEDGLTYDEPPDWPIPVRQLQGAALLDLGRHADAEKAFRDDLRKFPENGWSLSGLQAALERQGRAADAAAVSVRRAQAWRLADTPLVAARPSAP
jgi:predicted Zn-dependent protease